MPREDLFKILLDNLQEGVYFTNMNRQIEYWNLAAERISGFESEEVVGHCCSDNVLTHVDDDGRSLCRGDCPLAETIRDGQERQAKVFLHHKEGHRVPVMVSIAPIRDESGEIIGGLETFHDISTELAALKEVEALREQSLLCPLTGVGNRRYSEIMLEQRMAETSRTGSNLAVLFLDIDGFKDINDTYGHKTGDVVLKVVARTLAGAMRIYDFLGRWGGEEFLALAPNLRKMELERYADRLRALVEASSQRLSKGQLTVSVSIGATLVQPEETAESVVTRADSLMYSSKRHGKNCVTVG